MTIFFIILTVILSVLAFRDEQLFAKLKFNAYMVYHRKQWYRLITHGFIHADWWHLFVNMFVLYFFGRSSEAYLQWLADQGVISYPKLYFILLYLVSIVFASSISLLKHKENHWYNSVGASGAVAAILFFSIFFNPWEKLYLYAAIPIPGIIFAVLYIVYSQYSARRGRDNVAHDAHLLGAVFGFIFPLFIDLNLINHFLSQLLNWGA